MHRAVRRPAAWLDCGTTRRARNGPPGPITENAVVTDDEAGPLTFPDAAAWEAWLAENHGRRSEAWLRIAKKGAPARTVSAAEAHEVALCYGWIDSHRRSLDASHFLQKYGPRRPGSSWSKVNTEHVEALIAAGRMRGPGLAEVEAAKADGRWAAAYESQRTAAVPADLEAALAASPAGRRAFDALGRSAHYGLILRLLKTRTVEDRTRQLRRVVAELEGRGPEDAAPRNVDETDL